RYRIEERLDANDIGKYERGQNRWPGVRRREAFRAVLKVDNDSQLGFYVNRRERRAVSDDNCTPQDTDVFDDISSFEASGTLPLDQHLALGEGSDMRRRGLLAAAGAPLWSRVATPVLPALQTALYGSTGMGDAVDLIGELTSHYAQAVAKQPPRPMCAGVLEVRSFTAVL